MSGLAGRIRTCGLLVPNDARRPLRYSEMKLVEKAGFKPASFACKAIALSTELHPRLVRWHSRPGLNRHLRLERPPSSPLDDGNNGTGSESRTRILALATPHSGR